jgi:hypothetical protein
LSDPTTAGERVKGLAEAVRQTPNLRLTAAETTIIGAPRLAAGLNVEDACAKVVRDFVLLAHSQGCSLTSGRLSRTVNPTVVNYREGAT